jgi:glycerophosphoryl diester phosphodiesterase
MRAVLSLQVIIFLPEIILIMNLPSLSHHATAECARTKTSFSKSDFSIGHRGACMQYPEHTLESYKAAALMGAGIIECDVTFTKDLELICMCLVCT